MKTTLLIMAAGIGSRYGAGVKQLASVDSQAHIIMDYSIHDAIEAGFNRIICVIRKDIEQDFHEIIGSRIREVCDRSHVEFVTCFQDINDCPIAPPKDSNGNIRTKPWGTGHAVLSARQYLDTPFAIINADDYYGKGVFREMHDYLAAERSADDLCMAGYILKNTLSDNGAVTRGICRVDSNGFLASVSETKNIKKTPDGGAEADGRILDPESYCSMNMWGFRPESVAPLMEGFMRFFTNTLPLNPMTAEFLVPVFMGELIERKMVTVRVLPTTDAWYGITVHDDIIPVQEAFKHLIEAGVYQPDLYSDLN